MLLITLQALEAVARLRCSSGLDVDKYMGAFYRRTASDVDLPAIHSDQVQLQFPIIPVHQAVWGHIVKLCTGFAVLWTCYCLHTSGDTRGFGKVHLSQCLCLVQAIAVTLRHDERLKDAQEVYLQFALLYSTTSGQRRIRCVPRTLACHRIAHMGDSYTATSAFHSFTAAKPGLQILPRVLR